MEYSKYKIIDEFKNLIPPLTGEEYSLLERSILEDGVRDPLTIYGDFMIVDGHNRFAIAQKHNLKFKTVNREFKDMDEIKIWIIENQLGRRNISNFVRSELALEMKHIYTMQGKENLKISPGRGIKGCQISDKVIDTKKELAVLANVSHDTINKVERIKEKATEEQLSQLRNGEVSINEVHRKIKNIEKVEQAKEKYGERKVDGEKSVDIYNIDKKYRIVYADPPWSYGDKKKNLNMGGVTKHYDTMSTEDICNLPVSNLLDDDAVLFLWVTSPLLEECFSVISAWGFKYKTSFVWDKVGHNMGHYNSVRHELLLIATKGSCTPDSKELHDSVVSIEKSKKHSQKPNYFRKLIDSMYLYGNRIELFSRESNNGWDSYGNEIC